MAFAFLEGPGLVDKCRNFPRVWLGTSDLLQGLELQVSSTVGQLIFILMLLFQSYSNVS